MDDQFANHVLDLEGRVTALSAIVASLMWVMRRHGMLDAALEERIYRCTSEAITAHPVAEGGADRLILAMHRTGALPTQA